MEMKRARGPLRHGICVSPHSKLCLTLPMKLLVSLHLRRDLVLSLTFQEGTYTHAAVPEIPNVKCEVLITWA